MSRVTEVIGLGDAIHSGFRKATDCEQALHIWKLIQEMPDTEWNAVLEYVVEAMPAGVQAAMGAEIQEDVSQNE